jgi:hypothetical protein
VDTTDERTYTLPAESIAPLPEGSRPYPASLRPVAMPGASEHYTDDVPLISTQDDDIDLEELKPKRITAALLNAQAHVLANPEFNMYLHQTTINLGNVDKFYARVRVVNLADRAVVGTLPAEVREIVQQLFFGNQRRPNQGFSGKGQMDQGLERSRRIAYAYGIAGFLAPRLVLQPKDVRDPDNETWVGNIALHDLQEFMRICEGDDQLAARRLESFSEG